MAIFVILAVAVAVVLFALAAWRAPERLFLMALGLFFSALATLMATIDARAW